MTNEIFPKSKQIIDSKIHPQRGSSHDRRLEGTVALDYQLSINRCSRNAIDSPERNGSSISAD